MVGLLRKLWRLWVEGLELIDMNGLGFFACIVL